MFQPFRAMQALPPMPGLILLPGMVLITAYPLAQVLLGPEESGPAFVTAFLLALALRIALRFGGLVERMAQQFSRRETVVIALAMAFAPLVVLAVADDPLWCQRLQSGWHALLAALFGLDLLAGRQDRGARALLLFHLGFLLLNEMMIRSLDLPQWLLFWAVLPVLTHVARAVLIGTLPRRGGDGAALN